MDGETETPSWILTQQHWVLVVGMVERWAPEDIQSHLFSSPPADSSWTFLCCNFISKNSCACTLNMATDFHGERK